MTRAALGLALAVGCTPVDESLANGDPSSDTTAPLPEPDPTSEATSSGIATETTGEGASESSSTHASDASDTSSTGAGDPLFEDEFDGGLDRWLAELEDPEGSSVRIVDGQLDIDVAAGATIWFTEAIEGDVAIEYDVTMVADGGPHDRVSDLNQFWMAAQTDDGAPYGRNGTAEDYFDLRLYYVSVGGYDNTRTRFRRYAGPGVRPILGEYDDAAHLLTPGSTYAIRIVVANDTVEFHVNDELFFTHDDPRPYTSGWFAIRTLASHLRIDHFRVTRL